MSNTVSIQEAINSLNAVIEEVKASDFMGLLEENDRGYRERAVLHIETAILDLAEIAYAEYRQTQEHFASIEQGVTDAKS